MLLLHSSNIRQAGFMRKEIVKRIISLDFSEVVRYLVLKIQLLFLNQFGHHMVNKQTGKCTNLKGGLIAEGFFAFVICIAIALFIYDPVCHFNQHSSTESTEFDIAFQ